MIDELSNHRGRLLLILLLLGALFGLLVWYGTQPSYQPELNDYPDEDQVAPNPDAYVGQLVTLEGEVTATDPVVLEVDHPEAPTVTILNANAALETTDDPLEPGDELTAFGTLEETDTLDADRTITREPWEAYYMYVISFIGGIFALGHFVRHWRFDRMQLAFVPREQPLSLPDRTHTQQTPDSTRGDD
ncbi:hypothetical protein [Natrialba sp. INN-245]|uniref:hypothetical protein n=1 Tax=Natrialba sp. INN-245 TaxID=2690967 RepID=UPI0013112643|nr:hypothetical protein [Natrialba sp. INN-245]MWV40030.1 hypothetical protein [Natrialba sp. INN-245]